MTDKAVDVCDSKPTTTEKSDAAKETLIKPPLFFTMPKVINSYTVGKVVLRELDGIQACKGAALIDGIPNAQSDGMLTNIITVNYIVQQLKLPLVGLITSPLFFPLTLVKCGSPVSGTRIYGNSKLVVIVSEYQIKSPEVQNDLLQVLLDFAERNKISVILSADSITENASEKKKLLHNIQLHAMAQGNGVDGEGGDMEDGGEDGDDDGGEYDAVDSNLVSSLQVTPSEVSNAMQQQMALQQQPLSTTVKKEEKQDKAPVKKTIKKDSKHGDKKASDKPKKRTKTKHIDEDETVEEEVEEENEEIDIWYLTNSEKYGKELDKLGYKTVVDVSVTGLPAGFVTEGPFRGLDVILLLVKLDKLQLGTRSAIKLLQCYDSIIFHPEQDQGAKILDTTELSKSTEELEGELQGLIDSLTQTEKASESKIHSMYM